MTIEVMFLQGWQYVMTHKVAFGATLPVDLFVALVYGVPLSLIAWSVNCWRRRGRPVMYTYQMPMNPSVVWPPPPEIVSSREQE